MKNDLFIETMNVDVIWDNHPAPETLLNKTSEEIRTVVLKALEEELEKLEFDTTTDIETLNIDLSSSPKQWKSELTGQLVASIVSEVNKSNGATTSRTGLSQKSGNSWEVKTLIFFEQELFSEEETQEFWSSLETHWLEAPKQFYTLFTSHASRVWIERLTHFASETFIKELFKALRSPSEWVEIYSFFRKAAPNTIPPNSGVLEEIMLAFFTDAKNSAYITERLTGNKDVMNILASPTIETVFQKRFPKVFEQLKEAQHPLPPNEFQRKWNHQIAQISSKELRFFLESFSPIISRHKRTATSIVSFLQKHTSITYFDFRILFPEFLKSEQQLNTVLQELRLSEEVYKVPELEELKQHLEEERKLMHAEEQKEKQEKELAPEQELGHTKNFEEEEKPTKERIIQHAGLVLLNPFIPMLFRSFACIDEDNDWISPDHQKAAMYLLHYVVTGSFEMEEETWEMPALIVGFDPEEGFPEMEEEALQELFPEDTLESELKDLLQAVRDNWRPMRNTSWSGLRRDFLLRKGTLRPLGEVNYELNIEPHALDVMLPHKGWGITPITYSWMNGIIYVNWK